MLSRASSPKRGKERRLLEGGAEEGGGLGGEQATNLKPEDNQAAARAAGELRADIGASKTSTSFFPIKCL